MPFQQFINNINTEFKGTTIATTELTKHRALIVYQVTESIDHGHHSTNHLNMGGTRMYSSSQIVEIDPNATMDDIWDALGINLTGHVINRMITSIQILNSVGATTSETIATMEGTQEQRAADHVIVDSGNIVVSGAVSVTGSVSVTNIVPVTIQGQPLSVTIQS